MTTQFVYSNVPNFEASIFLCELQENSLDDILLDYTLNDLELTANFTQDLTAQEETDLDDLVTNHPSLKWSLTMYLADYRWKRETGGLLSQGHGVDTSDRSKALINGAYNWIKEQATPAAIMEFKTASGFQDLTHTTIELIALDVADHVRKCFHSEKVVYASIWADTTTTEVAVVTEFESEYAAA